MLKRYCNKVFLCLYNKNSDPNNQNNEVNIEVNNFDKDSNKNLEESIEEGLEQSIEEGLKQSIEEGLEQSIEEDIEKSLGKNKSGINDRMDKIQLHVTNTKGSEDDNEYRIAKLPPIKRPDVYYREHELYQKFYLERHFFINDFGRKRILFINYESRSKFPLKGWFQECIRCYTPTGQQFIIEGTVPNNIYIHMCDRCYCKLEYYKKKFSLNYHQFISELNRILEKSDEGSRYISY